VTLNVHVLSALSGLASLAVQVTSVVPTGKNEPEAGEQFTVTGLGSPWGPLRSFGPALQLSEAVGAG
jgi:hypothetical protein